MSVTKHQLIRYKILDQCFRNPGRSYFIEDLINACNDALIEIDPTSKGISRRTIFMDIEFMESEAGWSVPLERYTLGRKCFYRYSDLSFSISNQPLNLVEAEQLKSALIVMSRFSGVPQFEWVDELIPQLKTQFGLKDKEQPVISFQSNQYLKGKEYLSILFDAINSEQVLQINYKDFKSSESYSFLFHPYYLKQFNNRWFVLGGNHESENSIRNVALDRILLIENTQIKYIPTDIVWEDYFDDFIGVTKPDGAELEKIELLFTPSLTPYIVTKPIHSSQIDKQVEDGLLVKIEVIPNYELEQLILSFGEGIRVIKPQSLINRIKLRIDNMFNNYLV